jgi:hypothetical protein
MHRQAVNFLDIYRLFMILASLQARFLTTHTPDENRVALQIQSSGFTEEELARISKENVYVNDLPE